MIVGSNGNLHDSGRVHLPLPFTALAPTRYIVGGTSLIDCTVNHAFYEQNNFNVSWPWSASGSVRVMCLPPEQIRASGVAVVPEGRRLLPDLTVADNLRVATYALDRAAASSAWTTPSSSSRS